MILRSVLAAILILGSLGACTLGGVRDLLSPASEPRVPEGMRRVAVVERSGDEIAIPHEKYVLDNGLTLILHPDPSDPIAHVDVTYHVGSARERIGRSGFAHFFEHMMFQGSQNVADEQHLRLVSESGGVTNGSTGRDLTNYYETVPANQLERVLWLEADRMGSLLPAVTSEKFEVQRETVKNERAQRYDNRPYGLVAERIGQALYPEGHPYSWLPIGYPEDLDRVSVDDLKRFFLRWYGPNNATLTIGGDFDRGQVLGWVRKYFGSIPRGPDVKQPEAPLFSLDRDRYISFEDDVSLPLVTVVWPTVRGFHPDEAPLDVLSAILGTGRTSLLYKNLLKEGWAVDAGGSHPCEELACSFSVYALPNPARGANLAALEKILRDSLAEFEERGVQEDDLTRVKMGIVAGTIFGLESVSGKVRQLAYYETIQGDSDWLERDLERYRAVSREDVVRVYEKYLKGKPAVILSVVPRGQLEAAAAPDSFTPLERNIPDYDETTPQDLELRPVADDFDRSVIPAPGPNPLTSLPEVWRGELDPGIEVIGALGDEVPTTTVVVRFRAGQRSEPRDMPGLAALTARMLDESTLGSSTEELSNRLQKLGSSVSVSSGESYTTLQVRALTENLRETLEIASEKLTAPAFDEKEFTRVRDQTVEAIQSSKEQPAVVADTVLRRLIYGPATGAGAADAGTAESVAAIGLEDVRAFYAERYSASVASILAVSDLPKQELLRELSVLRVPEAKPVPAPPRDTPVQADPRPIYLVDKPGAVQSEIRIARLALPYDATGDFYRANLMNFPLGGAFNSRINLNLREDNAYTYSAASYFTGDEEVGRYTVQTSVRTDVTQAALTELYREIEGYVESGMTEAELAFTRSAVGQSDALRYETPVQKLALLGYILTFDLPLDFVERQSQILESLSLSETAALAKMHLRPDEMLTLIVGDRAKLLPELAEFDRPIVELDASGAPADRSSEAR